MAFDFQHPPIWLARLGTARAELEGDTRPASPGEGILAACRLSDELREFAVASLQAQYPQLSVGEIDALYVQRREDWVSFRRRFFVPHTEDL